MTAARLRLSFALLSFAAAAGCGDSVTLAPSTPEAEVPGKLPPGVPVPVAACSAPLHVPSGDAWVNALDILPGWQLGSASCEGHLEGSTRLHVGQLYVDADEVTNACYRACVDAGECAAPIVAPAPELPAWDTPEGAMYPVSVAPSEAARFCAFRGGRLPTIAELTRAMQGDALSIGTAAEWTIRRDCHLEKDTSEACATMMKHLGPPRAEYVIRSWALDVGPFGHHDLFGSLMEATQSFAPLGDAEKGAMCALEPGSVDPGTFGTSQSEELRLYLIGGRYPLPPRELFEDPNFSCDYGCRVRSSARLDSDGPDVDARGVRCVYDVITD